MRSFCLVLLLGVFFGLAQAGLLPIRQAPATCTPSTINNYVTVLETVVEVITVTDTPPTVTILQQDPHAVASSIASIDTAQISMETEEAPVSARPLGPQTFTHSIAVPGFAATELSDTAGASVYYVSQGSTGSIVVEVTTVTVVPLPASSNRADAEANHNINTSYVPSHSAFTSHGGGWNHTSFSFTFGTATALPGSPYGYPIPTGSSTNILPTFSIPQQTSTVTAFSTVYASAPTASGYGYGYGYGYGEEGNTFEKRQTCVWISATIDGQEVGWCNNWDGHSAVTYTSWETTIYPTYIPGIGTISPHVTPTSSSVPAPGTTSCGESGPFVVGFDDLPEQTSDIDKAQPVPILNPYEHFVWGDGWAYVPPPSDPFPPQAGQHLAQFVPSLNNTVIGSPDAGSIPPGSIGAWKRNDPHYFFNTYSAWVGCDNGSRNLSLTCDLVATAYQFDNYTQSEVVVGTQHFHIPPCPDMVNCQLTQINLNYLFYKMSSLNFYANVLGQVSEFWMDSISMDWYDNSCEAGLARVQGTW